MFLVSRSASLLSLLSFPSLPFLSPPFQYLTFPSIPFPSLPSYSVSFPPSPCPPLPSPPLSSPLPSPLIPLPPPSPPQLKATEDRLDAEEDLLALERKERPQQVLHAAAEVAKEEAAAAAALEEASHQAATPKAGGMPLAAAGAGIGAPAVGGRSFRSASVGGTVPGSQVGAASAQLVHGRESVAMGLRALRSSAGLWSHTSSTNAAMLRGPLKVSPEEETR